MDPVRVLTLCRLRAGGLGAVHKVAARTSSPSSPAPCKPAGDSVSADQSLPSGPPFQTRIEPENLTLADLRLTRPPLLLNSCVAQLVAPCSSGVRVVAVHFWSTGLVAPGCDICLTCAALA